MCGLYDQFERKRAMIRDYQDIIFSLEESDEMAFLLHQIVNKGVVLGEALKLSKRDFNLYLMRYPTVNRSGKRVYHFIDDYELNFIRGKKGKLLKAEYAYFELTFAQLSKTVKTRARSLIELSDVVSD